MNFRHLLPAAALLALLASAPVSAQQTTPAQANTCPPLLDHEFNRLQTGKSESLCQYRGKVLLIVNTASYCGYTHQYEGLEAMYRKYKDRGLVVLGFPSNDFGAQEPGSNKEIAEFCRLTYGVQFPMFEKSSVQNLQSCARKPDRFRSGISSSTCSIATASRRGPLPAPWSRTTAISARWWKNCSARSPLPEASSKRWAAAKRPRRTV
jgi:hypothetical protein